MYEICIPVYIDLFWRENIISIFFYDSNYILTFKLNLLLLNNEQKKDFQNTQRSLKMFRANLKLQTKYSDLNCIGTIRRIMICNGR